MELLKFLNLVKKNKFGGSKKYCNQKRRNKAYTS